MSLAGVIKNIVEEESKKLHCAFLAKVLSVKNNKAKIQPLGLIRDYGGTATQQAPITNVHIAKSALNKVTTKEIEYISSVNFDGKSVTKKAETIAKLTPIATGDIVLCVCCDRNIDAALKGENSLPPVGCHKQSDCVIVAII